MSIENAGRARVLIVEGCPHADLTVQRLRLALNEIGESDVEVEVRVVVSGAPLPDGFAGSPTVLVDGVDPFASSAAETSAVACRVYPAGLREQGAPSLDALREALTLRQRPMPGSGHAGVGGGTV